MRKVSFVRLEILWALMMCASNLAHPVTPAFFQALQFSSSMYGISFAAMSTTYFLCSPLWGKAAKQFGCVPMMAVSMLGYGGAQFLFSVVQTPLQLVLVRLLCGAFTCGYAVIAMIYCGEIGTETTRPRLMTVHGAVNAASACAGYFVGGVLGSRVPLCWVFRTQTIAMAVLSALVLVLLGEPTRQTPAAENTAPAATGKLHTSLLLGLLAVVLCSFVITGQENSLNYYITSQLAMGTVVNGAVRAVVGALGFAGNLLMTRLLQRGLRLSRALAVITAGGATLLLAGLLLPDAWPFLICQVLISSTDALLQPLQQAQLTQGQGGQMHRMAGLFNSAKSVGMVLGSLTAGYLYQLSARLPFLIAGVVLLSALLCQLPRNKKHAQ